MLCFIQIPTNIFQLTNCQYLWTIQKYTHMFVYESQSNNPKLTNFGRGETTAQISGSIIKITPSRTMMYAFFYDYN